MSDVNRVITLGIGPASTIEALVLSGLNTSLVYSGLSIFGMTATRRIEALDAPLRAGAYIPSLITLPDGSGYWLFADGSRVMWGSGDTGEHGDVKRRIETLKVKRG
jgi:hypothetical protein